MNIAILEFSMEEFEEEYWEDSFYERLHLKRLILDFSEIFEGFVFYNSTNEDRWDGKKQKKLDFWEFKF